MNAGMPLIKVNIADIVIEIYFCSEESLLNNNWQRVISTSTYDLGVELGHDDMGGEAGGDEEQEAELQEGHQGREGGPGERHHGLILSQTCEADRRVAEV